MKLTGTYPLARVFLLLLLVCQGRLGVFAHDATHVPCTTTIATEHATVDRPADEELPLLLAFTCIEEVEEDELRSVTAPIVAELPFLTTGSQSGLAALPKLRTPKGAAPSLERHLLLQVLRV
ncbi:MAG: hypothetical protein R2815_02125 [Flavobacteriales bacterium]